jgi:hypothetical protein
MTSSELSQGGPCAEVCPTCPFDTALAVSAKFTDCLDPTKRSSAVGGIALTREILAAVVSNQGCDPESGPASEFNGQLHCPHESTTLTARQSVFYQWPSTLQSKGLAIAAGAENGTNTNPGTGLYM